MYFIYWWEKSSLVRSFLPLAPDVSAGRTARELWWTSQEFHPADILITMALHAHVSPGGWTIATLRFQVLTAASMKFKDFWDVLPCSQIDVDIDLTTRQYIPEDSELHVDFDRRFNRSKSTWLHGATSKKTLNSNRHVGGLGSETSSYPIIINQPCNVVCW
jgi:hypothetical protein